MILFPPGALRCCHAQTVRDNSLCYKMDYFQLANFFLNPEGDQNYIKGLKVAAILLDGLEFAYWWSCIGKGLRLQPAQQTCFLPFSLHRPSGPLQSISCHIRELSVFDNAENLLRHGPETSGQRAYC